LERQATSLTKLNKGLYRIYESKSSKRNNRESNPYQQNAWAIL